MIIINQYLAHFKIEESFMHMRLNYNGYGIINKIQLLKVTYLKWASMQEILCGYISDAGSISCQSH